MINPDERQVMSEQTQSSAPAETAINDSATTPAQHPLWAALTTGHDLPVYGVADGAANAYIHAHLQAHDVPHRALYQDKGLPEEQSPWLFPLTQKETYSEWYLQESPGQYWGILIVTPLSLVELAEHLHDYLTMQDEQGKLHLMRFYDPRVIKAYLDALTMAQSQGFFKPGLQLWADAPGQAQTMYHYVQHQSVQRQAQHAQADQSQIHINTQQSDRHYRRTPVDLRVIAPDCDEEECAC